MAEYISMKQVPNGTVTAKDDRIVYDANLADSGIIYGCGISYLGNNMIHINAGYGVIKGGLFEIEDHIEYVEYATAGSVRGQIYLRLDLSADDKLIIVKETTNTLHPMTQDKNANFTNGIYEMQLCTFTANTTTLSNVSQTFNVLNVGVLDSLEEIQANTSRDQKAGALAVKQVLSNFGGIRFGKKDGKYGYFTGTGADTFVPFKTVSGTATRNYTTNGTEVVDVAAYEKISITRNVPNPSTGTLTKNYTTNGTEVVNVKDYANISITRNISTKKTIKITPRVRLKCVDFANQLWEVKTWIGIGDNPTWYEFTTYFTGEPHPAYEEYRDIEYTEKKSVTV